MGNAAPRLSSRAAAARVLLRDRRTEIPPEDVELFHKYVEPTPANKLVSMRPEEIDMDDMEPKWVAEEILRALMEGHRGRPKFRTVKLGRVVRQMSVTLGTIEGDGPLMIFSHMQSHQADILVSMLAESKRASGSQHSPHLERGLEIESEVPGKLSKAIDDCDQADADLRGEPGAEVHPINLAMIHLAREQRNRSLAHLRHRSPGMAAGKPAPEALPEVSEQNVAQFKRARAWLSEIGDIIFINYGLKNAVMLGAAQSEEELRAYRRFVDAQGAVS